MNRRAPSVRELEPASPRTSDRILLALATLALVVLFWRMCRPIHAPAPPPRPAIEEPTSNLETLKHLDEQRRAREERARWRH